MPPTQSPLETFDRREAELLKELEAIRSAKDTWLRLIGSAVQNSPTPVANVATAVSSLRRFIIQPHNCRTAIVQMLLDAGPDGLTKPQIRDGLKKLNVDVKESTISWTLAERKGIDFQQVRRGVWTITPEAARNALI